MRLGDVPKLNYVDTSDTQSDQIIRQIKQLRNDVQNSSLDIQSTLNIKSGSDSPYAVDRHSAPNDQLFQSAREGDWRNVPSYAERRLFYLKKLDVL